MDIILALIVGGLIGWLASSIAGNREGPLGSVVIGMMGAIVGVLASSFFRVGGYTILGMTWQAILWTFVGAIIFSVVLNAFQHHSRI